MRPSAKARNICIGLTLLCVILVILGLTLPVGTLPNWLVMVMVDGGVTAGLLCLLLSIQYIRAIRKG